MIGTVFRISREPSIRLCTATLRNNRGLRRTEPLGGAREPLPDKMGCAAIFQSCRGRDIRSAPRSRCYCTKPKKVGMNIDRAGM